MSHESMLRYDARMTARVANIPELACRTVGQGPPLIILDSHGDEAGWYRALLPALAARYTCIVVDAPPPAQQWSVEQGALALRNLIASSQWQSVNIMSFGSGTPVAQVLASHCRDRVRALVMVNGAPQAPTGEASEMSFAKAAQELGTALELDSRHANGDAAPRKLQLMKSALRVPGMLTLRGIACPTLVIHGAKNGRVLPGVAWSMHHALSMGSLQFIEGGTHASLLSGSEARDLLQFVNAFLNVHALNEPAVGRRSASAFSREERWMRHVLRQHSRREELHPGTTLGR